MAGTGEKYTVARRAVMAEDAAINDAVQRAIDRVIGVSAVEIAHDGDRVRVSIRAARPILLAGHRGAEADRLRGELEELTGKRVRLELWEVPGPPEGRGSEGPGRAG